MRLKNSVTNTIMSTITNILTILLGFIAQRIFIQNLGIEYTGINSLFTNVVSMLAITELGMGTAIISNLYKPIAEGNETKIKALMDFYQKCYRIIAIVFFLIGIISMFFLKNIVGEVSIKENIYFIFFLFLMDTVCSYLLTYKRSILYADQKNYIINIVHIGYIVIMNTIQIIILMTFHNYIIYLVIKIIFRIIENIVLTMIANKMYPYIKGKKKYDIGKDTFNDIIRKIKGLFFHKVGGALVLGTSNIIISAFLGVKVVGIYSNYYVIINAINQLLSQIYYSLTASVGDLLTEGNKEKSYHIYRNLNFLNFVFSSICAIGFFNTVQPFIKVWLGNEEYLLSTIVLIPLAINFYIQNMRKTTIAFKDAAGIFHVDRYIPIIESIINLIISISLVKIIGIAGVFIGTIVSSLVLFLYSYPTFVYKPLFGKNRKSYIKEHISYFIVTIVMGIIVYLITINVQFYNTYLQVAFNVIVAIVTSIILIVIIYRESDEFQYFIRIIKNILGYIHARKEK